MLQPLYPREEAISICYIRGTVGVRVGLDKLAKRKVLVSLGIKHQPPDKSSHCTDRTTPILDAEPRQDLIKAG